MSAGRFTTLLQRGRITTPGVVMVIPFILQASDAMTRIILGIHTLLLGTGGRGCGGPGIRTITATGCPRARHPPPSFTVLTLVAEELPAETDVAADPAASPTCTGAAHAEVAAKRRYGKMPYRTFFITISLH